MRTVFTLLFVLAVACGTTTTIPDGGTAADGGGVCCPIGGTTCSFSGGGWAAKSSDCMMFTTYDAYASVGVDSHGCKAWVGVPSKCCGCPIDSGVKDAPSETSSDASSE